MILVTKGLKETCLPAMKPKTTIVEAYWEDVTQGDVGVEKKKKLHNGAQPPTVKSAKKKKNKKSKKSKDVPLSKGKQNTLPPNFSLVTKKNTKPLPKNGQTSSVFGRLGDPVPSTSTKPQGSCTNSLDSIPRKPSYRCEATTPFDGLNSTQQRMNDRNVQLPMFSFERKVEFGGLSPLDGFLNASNSNDSDIQKEFLLSFLMLHQGANSYNFFDLIDGTFFSKRNFQHIFPLGGKNVMSGSVKGTLLRVVQDETIRSGTFKGHLHKSTILPPFSISSDQNMHQFLLTIVANYCTKEPKSQDKNFRVAALDMVLELSKLFYLPVKICDKGGSGVERLPIHCCPACENKPDVGRAFDAIQRHLYHLDNQINGCPGSATSSEWNFQQFARLYVNPPNLMSRMFPSSKRLHF